MTPADAHEPPVVLEDGKYTIQRGPDHMLEFLRYGEAWPAADDMKYSQVVVRMYEEIQQLRRKVQSLEDELHARA